MATKKPRRTAERILEVTLDLFNRFGEPNVSTTLISAELNISPGNLYYHYPAKDELINALFAAYERELTELLGASDNVRNVEDAWLFFHMLFELIWDYRFLYRDLNDLLSKNRRLETHFQFVLKHKTQAVEAVLRDYDVLLCASSMDPACRIDDTAEVERTYPRQARTPFNTTGHPALAMMAGLSKGGLPLSVQFVGRYFDEATIYQVARAWERSAGMDKKHPPIG